MMMVLVRLGVAAILAFVALPGATQSVSEGWTTPLQKFTLKNGLRVILAEDHSVPTFGLTVTYDVGSRDELPGHTGLAHFFEHMMFQGSENVGKGEHFLVILNNGGQTDASTSPDRTNYLDSLPARLPGVVSDRGRPGQHAAGSSRGAAKRR
jgi:secreted Zn-dependent insulinase-like peptidase